MSERSPRPIFEILLVVVIFSLLGGYSALAKERGRKKNAQVVCCNNLKAIGLAALQYSDDHRFLPHLTAISRLDGDHTSDTSAQVMKLLVRFNYLTDPNVFVCPSSPDRAPALAPERVALTAATDLSYGWTRRGLTTNCQCRHIVAGDKARFVPEEDATHRGNMRGNHAECMNVVMSDAHTQRIPPEGDQITTKNIAVCQTSAAGVGGYLGVLPD